MNKGFRKLLLGTMGISALLLSLGTSTFADVSEQKVEVVGSGRVRFKLKSNSMISGWMSRKAKALRLRRP